MVLRQAAGYAGAASVTIFVRSCSSVEWNTAPLEQQSASGGENSSQRVSSSNKRRPYVERLNKKLNSNTPVLVRGKNVEPNGMKAKQA